MITWLFVQAKSDATQYIFKIWVAKAEAYEEETLFDQVATQRCGEWASRFCVLLIVILDKNRVIWMATRICWMEARCL